MKKLFLLKTVLLLCALVVGSGNLWGQAAVGTTMWAETWTGASTSTSAGDSYTPSANYGHGTTVYNSGTVTYTQSANSVYVRNEELAGGSGHKPELMLTSGKTWTISNIPTGGASELTLTYKSNNTRAVVSCSTEGATITGSSKSYTISPKGASTITLVFTASGGNSRVDDVSLTVKTAGAGVTSLSVKTAPTKVRYEMGETLDMTGFVLDADGTEVSSGYTMTMGGAAISNGATLSSAGKKTLTVSYGGKTVDQAISVGAVTGIEVTTAPTKTSYDTGDSFDATGMVVTASLSTGEAEDPDTWTKAVTGYTIDPEDDLTPSDEEVTITYATKTTTQAITVTNVAVTGVSIKASTTIEKTKTETLTPTFTPTNATNKNVTWESDDTSVATVTAAGVVTGVAAGTANITVTTADGGYEATCVVTVVNQKGTADYPYTVAEVNTGDYSGSNYVIGYIVGYFNGAASDATTTGTSGTVSNVALSDSPSEISGAKTIAVQLPSNSEIRTAWNIYNNAVIGYKVLVKGSIEGYFANKTGVKSTSEITAVSVPVSIGSSKYASFCSKCALDFSSTDVKAYKAKVNEGKVVLTQVDEVPANTGVVLYCDTPDDYEVPVIASASAVTENEMVGVTTETSVVWNPSTDVYNYILQSGTFKKASDGKLRANRAYLSTSYDVSTAGARELVMVFDGEEGETTGIKQVEGLGLKVEGYYNLNGQRVAQPAKGLYIVNGKKVVIK